MIILEYLIHSSSGTRSFATYKGPKSLLSGKIWTPKRVFSQSSSDILATTGSARDFFKTFSIISSFSYGDIERVAYKTIKVYINTMNKKGACK